MDLSNESEDYESCYATLLFTLMYYLVENNIYFI